MGSLRETRVARYDGGKGSRFFRVQELTFSFGNFMGSGEGSELGNVG